MEPISPLEYNSFAYNASELISTESLPLKKATVLLIGESQVGKSTFIRKLMELAGEEPPSYLRIGDGVNATTNQTNIYKINFPIQRWTLFDSERRTKVDVRGAEFNRKKFLNLAYNQDLEIVKPSKDSTQFELTLIDTPGLKGDDDSEAENMNDMLRSISSLQEINSVLFLEGGSNYGPVLKSTLEYYQNLIGRGSAFDVFHTKYTAEVHLNFLKVELAKKTLNETGPINESDPPLYPRKSKFYDKFKGWQHYFIDSCPTTEFKFREWLFHSQIIKWIISLSTKRPISVSNLPFFKTDDMILTDQIVIARNIAKLSGHLNGLTEKETEWDKVLIHVSEIETYRQRKKMEVKNILQFLKDWNNEDEVAIGSDRIDTEWRWFKGHEIDMSIKESQYPIMVVTKAIDADSNCWFDEQSQTPYGKGHDCHDYTIKLRSDAFSGCYATITAYTHKNQIKNTEIRLKQDRLIELKHELYDIEAYVTEYSRIAIDVNEAIAKLKELIALYTQANEHISQKTMSLEFYDILKGNQIYKSLKESPDDEAILDQFNLLYAESYIPPRTV